MRASHLDLKVIKVHLGSSSLRVILGSVAMACLCLNKLVQLFAAQIPFTLFLLPPRSTHSCSHTYIHLHTPFNQCTASQAWRSGVNLFHCWRQARGNEACIKDQLPTPLCISHLRQFHSATSHPSSSPRTACSCLSHFSSCS